MRRQDTGCVSWRCLDGGLHGTQAAATSRVLLLLDDGGGHGGAGHRLVALRSPGFYHCLHGATTDRGVSATETGDAVADTGGAVQGGGVDGSDNAYRGILTTDFLV